jgi:hypothetical protein
MRAYAEAVWPAVAAALLIGAGVQAILPRRVLLAPKRCGGSLRQSLIGGVASPPTLMCTCWIGNPVLNPAVLVILALVGTVTVGGDQGPRRLPAGLRRDRARRPPGDGPGGRRPSPRQADRWEERGLPARYGASLLAVLIAALLRALSG